MATKICKMMDFYFSVSVLLQYHNVLGDPTRIGLQPKGITVYFERQH